ncbi:MAG: Fe-S cluster assembly protein SufD [Bacteroidales bacterium]|jgi:Fe-S cluster assembly protein SufD|nr:Fe-S cluster assembly protein SufD [Bacteroidales bacterium]
MKKVLKKYINIYQDLSDDFAKNGNQKVFEYRNEALKKFKQNGIPDKNDENYKYTGIEKIFENDYEYFPDAKQSFVDINEYFKCEIGDMDTHVVLLSNGSYYEKNKPIEDLPEGVIICGLNEAMNKYPEIFDKYYNQHASEINDGFVSLNTMLANDGLFIFIPENTKLNKTIQLINLTHGFGNKSLFKRNLFIIEENSELSLIVCDHTLNNSNNFVVDVTESHIGKKSVFKYYALQNEPKKSSVINNHFITLEEYSKVNSLILSLHGGIIRNNIYAKLSGEYSHVKLYGLGLADNNQIFDNYTFIDHKVPNCKSNELYKNILDDSALTAFAGRIIVRPDAQKTEAFQTNNNISLTSGAKVRTKPQLEIYADDVKCSHGATIGQLDKDALFYLRSRGINAKEARLMLMFAFANDILLEIDVEPLRNRMSDLINSRLRGELPGCSHCLQGCHK